MMMNGSKEINPEYQKMISGDLYLSMDPYLVDLRNKAELLYKEYNSTTETDTEKRKEIYSKLFGKVGNNLSIRAPFYCDYGVNTYLGDNVYMNFNCIILDCARVIIGDNVFMAPGVQILTATHPIEFEARISGNEYAKEIVIGNNVWIGGGAIINPGVTIGDNTVIGSGSVVTKSIPENCVAVGNPCKVIKYLGRDIGEDGEKSIK